MLRGNHIILGIHLDDRIKEAGDVQNLLTRYGCNIKSRIGLHDVDENFCAGYGLILLEMIGDQDVIQEFEDKLLTIEGVEVKRMAFEHT